eukprot:m.215429 g.215429  ORF g.215429 m.215429 type:complete len:1439 (-) comp41231_c0_seq1:242-4558(-)
MFCFHLAVSKNLRDVVKIFLRKNVNVNLLTKDTERTALQIAVCAHLPQMTRFLLENGADPSLITKDGWTLLQLVAKENDIETLRSLTAKGIAAFPPNGTRKQNALHKAAEFARRDVVEELIKLGVDMTSRDVEGFTPLHIAAKIGNEQAAKALLRAKASMTIEDNNRRTPKDLAETEEMIALFESFASALSPDRGAICREMKNALINNELMSLNRSKLILVGPGRAGKTSLVNSIMKRPRNKDCKSTVGCATDLSVSLASDNIRDLHHTQGKAGFELARALQQRSHPPDITEEISAKDLGQDNDGCSLDAPSIQTGPFTQDSMHDADVTISKVHVDCLPTIDLLTNSDPPAHFSTRSDTTESQNLSLKSSLTHLNSETVVDDETEALLVDDLALKKIAENVELVDSADGILFSIWDMGGQAIFYDLLHVLLTKNAVYLLTFDMTEVSPAADPSKRSVYIDHLRYFLNAISLHTPPAVVVFVGTKSDRLPTAESKEDQYTRITKLLHEEFGSHPCFQHVGKRQAPEYFFFPVDNDIDNERSECPHITALRKYVVSLVKAPDDELQKGGAAFDRGTSQAVAPLTSLHNLATQKVPLKWIIFYEYLLLETTSLVLKYVSFAEIEEKASRFNISGRAAVQEMLDVLNNAGVLMTLSSKGAATIDYVILDPQFVIDAFCRIIRDNTIQFDRKIHQWLQLPQYQNVSNTDLVAKNGVLRRAAVRVLWHEYPPALQDSLLKLMEDCFLCITNDEEMTIFLPSLVINSQVAATPAESPTATGAPLQDLSQPTCDTSVGISESRFDPSHNIPGKTGVVFFSFFPPRHFSSPDLQNLTVDKEKLESISFLPSGIFVRLLCRMASANGRLADQFSHFSAESALWVNGVLIKFERIMRQGIRCAVDLAKCRNIQGVVETLRSAVHRLLQAPPYAGRVTFRIFIRWDANTFVNVDELASVEPHERINKVPVLADPRAKLFYGLKESSFTSNHVDIILLGAPNLLRDNMKEFLSANLSIYTSTSDSKLRGKDTSESLAAMLQDCTVIVPLIGADDFQKLAAAIDSGDDLANHELMCWTVVYMLKTSNCIAGKSVVPIIQVSPAWPTVESMRQFVCRKLPDKSTENLQQKVRSVLRRMPNDVFATLTSPFPSPRDTLTHLLDIHGYVLQPEDSGKSAVDRLLIEHFDLVGNQAEEVSTIDGGLQLEECFQMYSYVSDLLQSTIGKHELARRLRIKSVQRVSHQRQWEAFKATRKKIAGQIREHALEANIMPAVVKHCAHEYFNKTIPLYTDEVGEFILLHGLRTNEETLNAILSNGLTEKVANFTETRFGPAIYFADTLAKSIQYMQPDADKFPVLLLVRVITGAACKLDTGKKKFSRAPCVQFPNCCDERCAHPRFHSIFGHTPNDPKIDYRYEEYVIYESSQCYIEFVVRFDTNDSPSPRSPSNMFTGFVG